MTHQPAGLGVTHFNRRYVASRLLKIRHRKW